MRGLLVDIAGRRCLLPLDAVREVMRPRKVMPLGDGLAPVVGAARVRGVSVPVVDTAALLGAQASSGGRWVHAHAGGRPVVLIVDAVIGLTELDAGPAGALVPLLGAVAPALVHQLVTIDAGFVAVLDDSAILPAGLDARVDEALAALDADADADAGLDEVAAAMAAQAQGES